MTGRLEWFQILIYINTVLVTCNVNTSYHFQMTMKVLGFKVNKNIIDVISRAHYVKTEVNVTSWPSFFFSTPSQFQCRHDL